METKGNNKTPSAAWGRRHGREVEWNQLRRIGSFPALKEKEVKPKANVRADMRCRLYSQCRRCQAARTMDLAQRVRQFCSAHALKLNTNLGQHFLIDASVLDAIVSAATIRSDDAIVEIGPGIGILTEQLLKKAARVTAIELDERLLPLLDAFVGERSNLTVIRGNALSVPFPETPYKIVANIPYHITSPLLRHAFLESPIPPLSLTLLIQREVAEKIYDDSGKDAGLLTILVRLFGTPRLVRLVPPEAFLPPPEVESAVLSIDCFPTPLTDRKTMEQVFRLTKIGFSQKRKMLSNTIGKFHQGMERLKALGIDPKRRPQTLSVSEWIHLAQSWGEDEDDGTP